MQRYGRGLLLSVTALAVFVLLGGCAASRARRACDRLKVAEAQIVDLQQQNGTLAQVADQARVAQDRTAAQLQRRTYEASVLEARAAEGEEALRALDQSARENERMVAKLSEVESRIDYVSREVTRRRSAPAPTPAPPSGGRTVDRRESRQLSAFADDLRADLSRRGIRGLPVEIRTAHDGNQAVAVVLTDAFKPGKASLADNMDAVRAVVNLGRLIAESYPGSNVRVEGHTDADRIVRSNWRDNEHLSEARAEAVQRLLVKAGVSESRVRVAGLGARQPIEPGNTDRAKAKNRRVEIYIEPGA
jgi:flagellar motor protein MotB